MRLVWLTALGVGGATMIGAVLGFVFRKISHRFSDIVLAFAAGVMMAAAVIGLILPSLEYHGKLALPVTIAGIFCGALCLTVLDRMVPHLHKLAGVEPEGHPSQTERLDKVLLFVMAIALHNFPEGVAAGVSFGGGNTAEALVVAGGIALQNIPEAIDLLMIPQGEGVVIAIVQDNRIREARLEVVPTNVARHVTTRAVVVVPVLGSQDARHNKADHRSGRCHPLRIALGQPNEEITRSQHTQTNPDREGVERTGIDVVTLTRLTGRGVEIDHQRHTGHDE